MDRIEAILLDSFKYERTQVKAPSNDKAPTWWPHIVREFDAKKWATSPDPDSYPVDGVWELPKLGNKEIYDWVQSEIMEKLLTGEEKRILYIFLGSGYRVPNKIAGKCLGLSPLSAYNKYRDILIKLKNILPADKIRVYFSMIV